MREPVAETVVADRLDAARRQPAQLTANRRISSSASQNDGTEMPANATRLRP